MSYPLHHLEDTPNWEVGLKVHEQENKWLIREFDAVSRAYGHYARSLSPTGPFAGGGFGGDAAGAVDAAAAVLVLNVVHYEWRYTRRGPHSDHTHTFYVTQSPTTD